MDFKRLVAFFAISLAIFAGWEHFFPSPKPNPAQQAAQQQQQTAATAAAEAALAPATPITVTTDTVKAVIDEKSGDLRQMTLLKYKANGDENKPFTLFNDSKEYTYVAQSELLDAQGNNILKGVNFTAAQKQYSLNGDKVEVRLSAPETNGLKIDKVYTFTKDSYLVNVRFDITNTSGKPANLSADYRIVRDRSEPEGQGYFTRSFVGPVVYTPEGKFQKVNFSDLDDDAKSGKNEAEYARKTQTGWLGMIELDSPTQRRTKRLRRRRLPYRHQTSQRQPVQHQRQRSPCRHPKRREIRSLHQPLRRPADHIRHRKHRRQPATGKRLRQSTLVRLPPLLAPEPTAQHYRQLGLGNHRFDHYRQSRTLPADQRLLPLDG